MTEFESITTRGGDGGDTSLADGSRRGKDDILIEVLGDMDELNAALGLFKAALQEVRDKDDVDWMQRVLIRIGGMLAVPPDHPSFRTLDAVGDDDIEELERLEREVMASVEMPRRFVTFGASEIGARADWARAVCRRAERHLVKLIRQRRMKDLEGAQRFLNRLSDCLYVMARRLDGEGTETTGHRKARTDTKHKNKKAKG
jgi:cob(I)alamin adenosyltransferase